MSKNLRNQIEEEILKSKPQKKARKRRKPMTDEQKKAAAERLKKAREKKLEANPPQYKSVSRDVLSKPDDHPLSLKSVRKYIKTQKELLSEARKDVRSNVKGAIARAGKHEAYIHNMENYIRTGTWVDLFYGEHQENKIRFRCVVPAYHADGTIKRSYGVYYDDLGYVWKGKEIEDE